VPIAISSCRKRGDNLVAMKYPLCRVEQATEPLLESEVRTCTETRSLGPPVSSQGF
jgi:hypothetical protein